MLWLCEQAFAGRGILVLRGARLGARSTKVKKQMKEPVFVEPRDGGGFTVKVAQAKRASVIEPTQGKAIDAARQMHPGAPLHVARVRHTSKGEPDQYRKI